MDWAERFNVVEDDSGKWLWPRWYVINIQENAPVGVFATEEEAVDFASELVSEETPT